MTVLNDLILPPDVTVADYAPLVHTPSFWDETKAYGHYSPDLEGAFIEGVDYRRRNKLRTAAELEASGISNLVMLTDLQHDFRDDGRLPVMGTNTVVLRACARIINGTVEDYYTRAVASEDGHVPWHISWGTRWRRPDGSPFDLRVHKAAILNLVDRNKGIFQATCFDPATGNPIDMGYIQSYLEVKDSVKYWDHLEATTQGPIWIFAQHCKLGTDGVNLHPLLAEVLSFMEGARGMATVPVHKGHIRDTDWFGPLKPCRPDPNHPQGGFQKHIVDLFAEVTGWVEFFGVAEDFCNFNMQRQVMEYFAGTEFFERMAFATDGTAAIVPGAQHVLDLYEEARDKGVTFFTHDALFEARV